MIVMMMANTPSLNASHLLVLMRRLCPGRAVGRVSTPGLKP
jgi:hypothetical protein